MNDPAQAAAEIIVRAIGDSDKFPGDIGMVAETIRENYAPVIAELVGALAAIVEDASPCTSACNLVVESKLIDSARAVLAKHR